MRRRPQEDADTLRMLFRAEREFAKLSRLPARAAILLYYVGSQPNAEAGFADVQVNCGLGQSQTSRLCAALVEAGLIAMVTPAEDRRKTKLRATSQGRSVIGKIIKAAHRTL